MIYAAVLISALLYRIPRGGPDGDVWVRWIGFAPGSRVGASVWAGVTALSLTYATENPLWIAAVVFVLLSLAELRGYMQWISEDRVDFWPLTARGMLLLNPLMAVIYEGCRRYCKDWPRFGRLVDGWTAYAELGCGAVTAASTALILSLI